MIDPQSKRQHSILPEERWELPNNSKVTGKNKQLSLARITAHVDLSFLINCGLTDPADLETSVQQLI